MRPSAALLAALLGPLTVSSCANELQLTLEGKQCRSREPRCLSGYDCVGGLCVLPGADASAGGAAGSGAGGESGGSGGSGGLGGGGAGGAGGELAGGAGGALSGLGGTSTDPEDAGPRDAALADVGVDACTPRFLYPDVDGDGVGVIAGGQVRCPAAGWVDAPGDCRDDLFDVRLGQTAYFQQPFPDPTKPEDVSFDYDCSGTEQADPDNDPPDEPPTCAQLLVCNGSGYIAATPARVGTGIDPRCGSNVLRTCASAGLGCAANDLTLAARFACR